MFSSLRPVNSLKDRSQERTFSLMDGRFNELTHDFGQRIKAEARNWILSFYTVRSLFGVATTICFERMNTGLYNVGK